jgi:DNA-3-methyladenine glycosylase II
MAFLERYTMRAPYRFRLTAAVAHYSSLLGRWHEGRFRRTFRARDGLALVELRDVGTADAPAVEASVLVQVGTVDVDVLREKVRAMLNVNLDLAAFTAFARQDAKLWPVVEPIAGLGLFATESVFEALVLTIIEQQISLTAAQRAERWLIGWGGDSIDYDGERYPVFPSAAKIAGATVDDLTPTKITFRRMQLLIDMAKLEVTNSFDRLRALPLDDAYRELMALRGIGHWTAAWTLARGIGHVVYVGSADVALRAAVNAYYFGQAGRCERETMDAFFAGYGDYAGLASFYTLMRWALDKYPTGTGA